MNCYIDEMGHIFLVGAKTTLCKKFINPPVTDPRLLSVTDAVLEIRCEKCIDVAKLLLKSCKEEGKIREEERFEETNFVKAIDLVKVNKEDEYELDELSEEYIDELTFEGM
ncbi:MAG: hypothetical protein ACOC56_00880 [Atribacterota bacterium]